MTSKEMKDIVYPGAGLGLGGEKASEIPATPAERSPDRDFGRDRPFDEESGRITKSKSMKQQVDEYVTTLGGAPVSEGVKFDDNKIRMDLIPPEALSALGYVLTHGASKYGERNWEKGMKHGRIYGAVMRHLNAYRAGQIDDTDSGLPHLWHALAGIAMLTAYDARGINVSTNDTDFIGGAVVLE